MQQRNHKQVEIQEMKPYTCNSIMCFISAYVVYHNYLNAVPLRPNDCFSGKYLATVQKYTTAQAQCLTHMHESICSWLKKMDVALISLSSIHPYRCFSNACEQNGCHVPFLDNDLIMSKLLVRASATLCLGYTIYWVPSLPASFFWKLVNGFSQFNIRILF